MAGRLSVYMAGRLSVYMAGRLSDVHARVKEMNPRASFVPCSAHSLNLVGACAAECCLDAASFFGFVQALYNFLSSSTHRWGLFVKRIGGPTPKSLSGARWSARHDATVALKSNYKKIISLLLDVSRDLKESPRTRDEESSLHNKMEKFELLCVFVLCVFWEQVPACFYTANKTLQKPSLSLGVVHTLYDSLTAFLTGLRDDFERIEQSASPFVEEPSYQYKRTAKRKRKDVEAVLSHREQHRINTFLVIVDCLLSELEKRGDIYKTLAQDFDILFYLHKKPATSIRDTASHI
ncbi:uncharacterized protein LOC101860229 [Aplysia californica]|uniref:Uncharacterized protein LOC101860229 n=1 Tax=Aplysia californica TaxID=6500 RepID=A0ABM0KB14_APLCA|nr:uncharacterized protein LOC101860229 [Aplysia californica]